MPAILPERRRARRPANRPGAPVPSVGLGPTSHLGRQAAGFLPPIVEAALQVAMDRVMWRSKMTPKALGSAREAPIASLSVWASFIYLFL
jgi:hypothetical protein